MYMYNDAINARSECVARSGQTYVCVVLSAQKAANHDELVQDYGCRHGGMMS